jgi:hypothetical protein
MIMNKNCNTLIWLGAGSASNPNISFNQFERVIIVEARTKTKINQNSIAKANVNLEIYNKCLVAHNTNYETFNVYNVEELSSVDCPTGIFDLFPNLSRVSEEVVEFQFVTEFFESLTFDSNTTCELIIDIPDISVNFFRDIIDSQIFNKIKTLTLLAPKSKLFAHGADLSELLDLLEDNTGIQYQIVDDTDPDFPTCHIQITQSKLEKNRIIELELEVNTLHVEREKFQKSYQFKQTEVEDLTVKLQLVVKQLHEMTAQRDKQKHHHEENKAWAESLKKQLEDSEKQRITEYSLRQEADEALIAEKSHSESLKNEINILNEVKESAEQKQQDLAVKLGLAEKSLVEIKYKVESQHQELEMFNTTTDKMNEKLQDMTEQRDKQKFHHEENKAWAESLKKQLAASEERQGFVTELAQKAGNDLLEKNEQIKTLQSELQQSISEKQAINQQFLKLTAQWDKLSDESMLKSKVLDENNVTNTSKLNEANKRIDQMLTMQNMSQRLLQKSETDNANLRHKISEKNDQIEDMTALVTELHEKLTLASNFYDQLTTQYPELIEKSHI